jgi:hypothetical protein
MYLYIYMYLYVYICICIHIGATPVLDVREALVEPMVATACEVLLQMLNDQGLARLYRSTMTTRQTVFLPCDGGGGEKGGGEGREEAEGGEGGGGGEGYGDMSVSEAEKEVLECAMTVVSLWQVNPKP